MKKQQYSGSIFQVEGDKDELDMGWYYLDAFGAPEGPYPDRDSAARSFEDYCKLNQHLSDDTLSDLCL